VQPSPNCEPAWLIEYKAAIPKAAKESRRVKLLLWYIIGYGLAFPVAFLAFTPYPWSDAIASVLPGLIDAAVLLLLFLLLGLHKRVAGNASVRVTTYVVVGMGINYVVTWLLTLLPVVGSYYYDHRDEITDVYAAVIVSPIVICGIGTILRSRLQFFERGVRLSSYLPISRDQAPSLWDALEDVQRSLNALGLHLRSPNVWLRRTDNELLPSVCSAALRPGQEVTDHLLIPRGFMSLVKTHPERARAIVAHDLSHFCQRDANLWTVVDLFFAVFRRTLVPFMIVNAAFLVVMAISLGRMPNAGPFVHLIIVLRAQRSAAAARRQSEFLADRLASHIANQDALIACIREYTNDESPLHPTRHERITCITGSGSTTQMSVDEVRAPKATNRVLATPITRVGASAQERGEYAPASKTNCDGCGAVFPSGYCLKGSRGGPYLCEECRG
jgi:hypothetical protein